MDTRAAPLAAASKPVEASKPKPSFASVAASSYIPPGSKNTRKAPVPDAKSAASAPSNDPGAQNGVNATPNGGVAAKTAPPAIVTSSDGLQQPQREEISEDIEPTVTAPTALETSKIPEILHPEKTGPKSVTIDDTSTQVSSSDGSGKDGKSTVSGITFAMDEKESLRPDDSASLRDNQEEETLSTTGSVLAGSVIGSDTGSRAFRDQLREISIMTPQHDPQYAAQYPPPAMPMPAIAFGDGSVPAMTAQLSVARGIAPVSGNPAYAPDAKLLEALESHKDRVWVLKTEQDIITFVTESSETRLFLPPTNSFYRMLAHKMADYYLLGHHPDQTGAAVEVYKTPYTRLPAALATIPLRSAAQDSGVPSMPMRKIMRRGGEKGTTGSNTASNSEGPSMTTSEAGGDSASEAGNDVKKTPLSREDREARYREARLRIFGAAEDTDTSDAPEASEDVSRPSSTTGKKTKKKQRSTNDDDFEARSAYSQYYQPPPPAEGYAADGTYYGPFSAVASPVMPYGSYPQLVGPEGQQNYMWSQQMYAMQPGVPQYASPVPGNVDLPADFQRGMQSFQTAKPTSRQPSAMSSPNPQNMQMQYPMQMQMQPGQQWPDGGFQSPQAPGQYIMGQRPSSSPGQGAHTVPYAYGQLPAPAYANGKPLANQHPIPGSFNRQQFNPQSQAFIPGSIPSSQYPLQQPNMMPYGSPIPSMRAGSSGPQPFATPPRQPSYSNSLAPSTPSSAPRQPTTANSTPPSTTLPTPNAPSQHPLPQPPNPDSTIAKWGTPSHLPPKPPPPATMQPQRWYQQMQMQGGTTPALDAATAGVARMGAGPNGVARGASPASPAGAGSPATK